MKRNVFLFFLALGLFLSGCTSTNINSPQRVQQTCTTTPISSSESQEKQCCLKDTLVVKHAEEVCSLNDAKDSVSNVSSTNVTINPSVPFDFSKEYDIHGRVDYQKGEVNDSRKGCFGANCQVNNVYIDNTNENEGVWASFELIICKIWGKRYIVLVSVYTVLITVLFLVIANLKERRERKKVNKPIVNDNPDYKVLAPVYDASLSEETKKQLHFAILDNDERLKNIAITGPYGSGKSSVWKSFCRQENINEKKNVIEISLAKFEDSRFKNILNIIDEQEIEKTIVQQLFYSRKKEELKYSIFPQIKSLTDIKATLFTWAILAVFFLILPLTNDSLDCIIRSWVNDPISLGNFHISISIFVLSSILYCFLRWAVQKIYCLRITKICLKNIEIKLENGESFFNKYLDVIIYFFEITKCDCVVIEDLDRFNSSKIFTKLREINLLINNNPTIRAVINSPVKFVYIVKDNIFSKYERTKFFDFIIPVVPIFNGDNATSYIKKHFVKSDFASTEEEAEEKPYLSITYLEDIQKYLDDLRLIINCFNEFKIYKAVCNNFHGINGDEKLFSLILYKNLYPRDYQELLRQEGVLYFCLNKSTKIFAEQNKINTIESIKKLLIDENSERIKKIIRDEKKNIEKRYQESELIDEDFLFTMLAKGYIDEDYRYYIADSYDAKFSSDERFYINDVKDELTPEFTREIKQYESVLKEIQEHKWSNPSVLNNDVLTYLIRHKLSNRVSGFINAIQNYFEKYKKNDFVNQYFESINTCNDKDEIINYFVLELSRKLQSDASIETKNKILLSIFDDDSASLLSKLILEPSEKDVSFSKIMSNFFKIRKNILEYILVDSEEKSSLAKSLSRQNFEVENISDYNDSTQEKLIQNGLFKFSKENLDYILEKNNETPPYHYYDYIVANFKLKEKLDKPKQLNEFIENVLLASDKIAFSKSRIIDFLFTNSISDEVVEQVAQKIDDEFVDLTLLPHYFSDFNNAVFIINLNSSLIHTLIQLNKIQIDFNNLLYISRSNIVDDIILFARKQISRQGEGWLKFGIDDLASLSLEHFYGFLLKEEKVDVALLEQESVFLIDQAVDIGEFATPLLNDDGKISVEKKHIFIRLLFRRTVQNANSNNKFVSLIRKEFEYFYNNFRDIRRRCKKYTWMLNMSILLINENKILDIFHLNRIMEKMLMADFVDVIKILCERVGYIETSKIVEKLLNEHCLNEWMKGNDKDRIVAFVDSIKNNITEDLEEELRRRINSL